MIAYSAFRFGVKTTDWSSNSSIGSLLTSAVSLPTAAATTRSVEGESGLLVRVVVAATASKATATNPIIVRCFVMGTSFGPPTHSVGHGHFAKFNGDGRVCWAFRVLLPFFVQVPCWNTGFWTNRKKDDFVLWAGTMTLSLVACKIGTWFMSSMTTPRS